MPVALILMFVFSAWGDRFIPKPQDLIFVSLKYPPKLTGVLRAEQERLHKMCKAGDTPCFRKHYRQGEWNLGSLHSGPGKLFPKVATIAGSVKLDETTGEVFLRVEVVPAGGGPGVAWLEREMNFEAGPRLFLRELRGDWGLLPVLPFSENAWLNLNGSGMNGLPESALRDLVKLDGAVIATNLTSKKDETLPPGVYYLEEIRDGKVTFRRERAGDTLCERSLAASSGPEVHFTVDKSALYESTGIAKFQTAYPRGCDSVPSPAPENRPAKQP